MQCVEPRADCRNPHEPSATRSRRDSTRILKTARHSCFVAMDPEPVDGTSQPNLPFPDGFVLPDERPSRAFSGNQTGHCGNERILKVLESSVTNSQIQFISQTKSERFYIGNSLSLIENRRNKRTAATPNAIMNPAQTPGPLRSKTNPSR